MTTILPDERGYFGDYGGRYVPETLMSALEELTAAYEEVRLDPTFGGGVGAAQPQLCRPARRPSPMRPT